MRIMTGLIVWFASLGGQTEPKAELLPTPDDWRFERIDFPLSFAPNIKFEGFEELRFSPGMFKADSETYFTYIFAMKITNEAALDADGLKSLLETYFRGLCSAVAKERNFAIDVTKISARVEAVTSDTKTGRAFRATVESFDPFVTGKPLTLNAEMLVIEKSPTDRRLFAALSPKPSDAPIWKQLRTFREQFQARFAS